MRVFAATSVAIVFATFLAGPVGAQEVTCDDIAFDQQAMQAYPMIRDACLEIVEQDGVKYAHLKALVHREASPSMLLRFENRDGSWGPATLVTPPPGFKVYLDGHAVDAKDVPRGRELSIYLPEGRWEVAMTDADVMTIAEATLAPIEFEVTAEELPEEVDMDAAAVAAADDEVMEAAQAAEEEVAAEQPVEDTDDGSYWMEILGLAAAFIVVWFLLRRRKARRTA